VREAAEPPPEDVERAFDVAEREGRVLAEAFMWRHHPQVRRARELLDAARSATCASSARTSPSARRPRRHPPAGRRSTAAA
jgi:predicted dehydrogenase